MNAAIRSDVKVYKVLYILFSDICHISSLTPLQRLEALKNKDDSDCDSDSVYCDVRMLPRRSVKT